MSDIDNKVVSISFNNKQFLKDVADTITVIEDLNEATSGKKIDSSGIENLGRAFRNTTSDLTDQANSVVAAFQSINSATNTNFQTSGINALREALENTGLSATDVEDTITSLQQLSRTGLSYASDLGISSTAQQIQNESANTRSILTQDIDDVSQSFSAMEMIALGAMIAIGEKAADIGASALRSLTAGIRDGWGEYNALTNSTQTILVNTQRWGSTMEDVSGALEELNKYADLTTYSFSDMTRNIGYFTTAGVELEDSVTAIQGLSNVGAMFGADAQSVARAGYQISQAMSAGVIKLMDWRSMINAGMGGQALQDELIRTAAVMSGTSVDAMNDYIDSLGGFNASLQEGWLTSDVFLEAMRVFAGQSREYYESLTDENGNRLYSDEEIDRLVELGETAMESATQVRTLQQMIDAFKESIGSGWQRTFTMIIGNLEEAKEFWTPINNILTSLVNGFFDVQNGALELWRTLGGREELLEGINNTLTALSNVLGAIGRGFIDSFGGTNTIGSRLMGITEALTDFSESLILSEEELGFLQDFFTGIFEPISLVVDIIFELIKAFFDAGDSALNLEHSADTLYSTFGEFRYALLSVLGYIGSVLKAGAKFIRNSRVLRTVIQTFVRIVGKAFKGLTTIISAPFVLLYQIWERYNLTEKLNEFATRAATFFLPLVDALSAAKTVFVDWFDGFIEYMGDLIKSLDPIETFIQVFSAIKQLFRDLFDPTVSIRDAFSNFFSTLSDSNIVIIFEAIRSKVSELWTSLKETGIGQWFEDIGTKIQNAAYAFSQTAFGQKILEIGNGIRDFLSLDTGKWDIFWTATEMMLTDVADNIAVGWEKIKTFFTELIDIIKDWFGFSDGSDGTVGDAINDTVGTADEGMMNDKIETLEKTGRAVAGFMETTSKAVYEAEKLIPNAEESKFLSFIKELPIHLSSLMESVKDGSIIEDAATFFGELAGAFTSFFTNDVFELGSNIFEWLSDTAIKIGNAIADFTGIDLSAIQDNGVIGIIGALITGIINTFNNIDKGALANISTIAGMIAAVFTALSAFKITSIINNFSKGLAAGAKGWQAQQEAKKLTALADMFKSIALVIIGIGAVVAFLSVAINRGWITPETLKTIFNHIIGIFVAMTAMVVIMSLVAKIVKPGSLSGVGRILSSAGTLILTTVIAIAALFGIAYLAFRIYNSMGEIDKETFVIILGIVGAAFILIGSAIMVFIGLLTAVGAMVPNGREALIAIADLTKSVSMMLLSAAALLVVILGSIAAFTLFIDYVKQKDLWGPFIGAIVLVVFILGVALGGTLLLALLAKQMASGVSGTKPAHFKKMMGLMAGLLITIMVSVTILIMAVGAFVYLMTSSGATWWQIGLAILSVVALVSVVMYGLNLLFASLKNIADLKFSKALGAFAIMTSIIAVLVTAIGALVWWGKEMAKEVTDLTAFWSVIGAMGAIMAEVILGVFLIGLMLSQINCSRLLWKSLGILAAAMLMIVATMAGIMFGMSLLVDAMGTSGFLSNGGSIWELTFSIVTMLGAIVIIAAIIVACSKELANADFGGVMKMVGTILLLAGALVVMSSSLAILLFATNDIGAMWSALGVLFVMFAVLTAAIFVMNAVATINFAAVLTAAGSLALASLAFVGIASALAIIAGIDTNQLLIAVGTLGILFVSMATMVGLLSAIGIGTGGIGAVVILAVAAAMVICGIAFMEFADALRITAGAVSTFIEAFRSIETLNMDLISTKIEGITGAITTFCDSMLENAPKLGIAIITLVSSVVAGIVVGLANGLKEGIVTIKTVIEEYGPILQEALTALGLVLIGAIHNWNVALLALVAEDFGPNGVIRGLATSIGEFVVWFASKAASWAIDIVDAALNGLITAISDVNKIRKVALTFKLFVLTVKDRLLSSLGIPDFKAIGEKICYSIFEGIIDKARQLLDTDIGAALAEAFEYVTDIDLEGTLSSLSYMAQRHLEGIDVTGATRRAEEIQEVRDRIDALNEAIASDAAHEAAGNYEEVASAAKDAGEETGGFLDTVLGRIGDFLGISDGIDLSGIFGDGFDISGIFGDGFDISSITDNLSDVGGLLGNITGGNVIDIDTSSLDTTSLGLGSITDTLSSEEFTNPVITPVVDDSQVSLGIANIEDMFHNATIDEFAIDAGNSMLVREQAEGDATADGSVTYNYTQINNSPKALSAIEIYRDTNNLLRGRVSTT